MRGFSRLIKAFIVLCNLCTVCCILVNFNFLLGSVMYALLTFLYCVADGRSRGFGFVVFREESACQQVLAQRDHHITPRDRVRVNNNLGFGVYRDSLFLFCLLQAEVKPCLSRNKAARQAAAQTHSPYGPPPGYGMGPTGMMNGYGYGAANYGGYGQNYGYEGYGNPSGKRCSVVTYLCLTESKFLLEGFHACLLSAGQWHGAEYPSADAAGPYGAGYDSYSNYYGWGGYSQGVPSAAPFGGAATGGAGGPRGAGATAAVAATGGRDAYSYEGAAGMSR